MPTCRVTAFTYPVGLLLLRFCTHFKVSVFLAVYTAAADKYAGIADALASSYT